MSKEKVFCKNCRRWYCTKVDQCTLDAKKTKRFSKAVGDYIVEEENVYGYPTVTNKNNDCSYYLEKRILYRLRNLFKK